MYLFIYLDYLGEIFLFPFSLGKLICCQHHTGVLGADKIIWVYLVALVLFKDFFFFKASFYTAASNENSAFDLRALPSSVARSKLHLLTSYMTWHK